MSNIALVAIALCISQLAFAQGQKMPDFSFHHNSSEFANANMQYSDRGVFEEVIADETILNSLIQILSANEKLIIGVAGHRDWSEEQGTSLQRALSVKSRLIEAGIDSTRIEVIDKDTADPLLPYSIEKTLHTAEEIAAVRQKNRRVKIIVLGKLEDR